MTRHVLQQFALKLRRNSAREIITNLVSTEEVDNNGRGWGGEYKGTETREGLSQKVKKREEKNQ